MSYFQNHMEFYAFAVHAIYAVILASSFEIARDTFIPLTKINNFDHIVHAYSVFFAYCLLISGWIGYTKSISIRPHTYTSLGSLRFVLDLLIVFFTFYIINLTNNVKEHAVYWSNYGEVFVIFLPIVFVLYVIWDLVKMLEYRREFKDNRDETIINFNRLIISLMFFFMSVIQIGLYLLFDSYSSSVSFSYFIFTSVSILTVILYRYAKWDVPSTPKSPETNTFEKGNP